jgi:Ala-tRNA(Pro) deacylase
MLPSHGAYTRLIGQLDARQARYRLIDHPPEGRTDLVSAMRGHSPEQAAKCVIVMVKLGKRVTQYVLAVVPGDRRVNLGSIKEWLSATYVAFASREKAEALAGSASGTILPFSYDPDLKLVVDPGVLRFDEMFFNAGRLDQSIALATEDYVRIANPTLRPIAEE